MEVIRNPNPLPSVPTCSNGSKHGNFPLCGCAGEAPIVAHEKEVLATADAQKTEADARIDIALNAIATGEIVALVAA